MQIAIQTSDLDRQRIDGTRVYLKELLQVFGRLAPETFFTLYHEEHFNPSLAPKAYPNYQEQRIPFPFAWMQTRFTWRLFRDKPGKLFLPIQAAPLLLPRSIEVTATIHDLAWKQYPETFTWKDRFKLNLLLKRVVERADKLIAVSEATKRDLLHHFPTLKEAKIKVIYHGFDRDFFSERLSEQALTSQLASYKLEVAKYVLYVGALQPRKNLVRLIKAFEKLKQDIPEAKLVLAGEVAWLTRDILKVREQSLYREDIILTGKISFETLRALYQGAKVFAFPSLYEGFGIPILEAFASQVPVLTADNSSLPEVARQGALYCDALELEDIARQLQRLWKDTKLREELLLKGQQQLEHFSWEKCAKETLTYIQEKN